MNTTTEHDAKRNVWIAKVWKNGEVVGYAEHRRERQAKKDAHEAARYNGDGEGRDE